MLLQPMILLTLATKKDAARAEATTESAHVHRGDVYTDQVVANTDADAPRDDAASTDAATEANVASASKHCDA